MKNGMVFLDLAKVEALMLKRCMGPDTLFGKAKISARTGRSALTGKQIRLKTAERLLTALGVANCEEFMKPVASLVGESVRQKPEQVRTINEWVVEAAITPVITATNGLQYQIFKLRHRHLPNRWGRGKCYGLSYPPTKDRLRLEEQLNRHPKTCDRVGIHPQIPLNETACPDPNGHEWWVIDRWVDGATLEERLKDGPLHRKQLPVVMKQIAEGLRVLHQAKIVRRELAPPFILLRDDDESVLLTDFEMAKLFDGSPTVSDERILAEYCAPEVGAGKIDERADLYSFGRILLRSAIGTLPDRRSEKQAIESLRIPKAVADITRQCLARPRSERPKDIDTVIRSLKRWR